MIHMIGTPRSGLLSSLLELPAVLWCLNDSLVNHNMNKNFHEADVQVADKSCWQMSANKKDQRAAGLTLACGPKCLCLCSYHYMLCCSATLRCEPGTGKMTAVICIHHVRKRPNSDFGTAAGEEEDCRLGLVSKSDGCCVQDLVQQRGMFCSSQQSRIDELMQFVNQQRLKRKQVNMHHLLNS